MLGRIVISLTFPVAAPPEAVWAALEAPDRWPQVQPDLIQAFIEPDGVLAPGATIRTVARPGTPAIDMSYRVVEAARPQRLAFETGGAPLHFRGRTEYSIEPHGGGARLTVTCHIEPVYWLHKITTQLARRWYTERHTANMRSRLAPLTALAERIAAERTA